MSKVIAVGACLLLVVGSVAGVGVVAATTNERPLPDAGLDQTVQQGATVVLDAGGSRDPDGTITSYRWRIEAPNGTTLDPAGENSVRASFPATRTGEYAATVEVTDDEGATATDTLYVTVEAPPEGPSVSVSGDTRPTADAPATYTATATAGDAELETVAWSVDGRKVAEQDVAGNDTRRSLQRSFDDASTRTVRVTVRDGNGRTATDSLTVDPASPGSSDPSDPFEPDEGAGSSDPSPTPERTPSPDGPSTPTATVTATPDPCAGNEPPIVDANAEFGGPSRGDTVTISASISDPDGEVVSVEYDPGRVVAAPAPGEMTTVRVTAMDGCRVTGTDTLVLSGEEETYRTNRTKQFENRNEIRLYYYRGAGGADPYKSEIVNGDQSDLPPAVNGQVDTHREEQAVVDAETWTVYRDHSPEDGEKNNKGVERATENVTTNATTTTTTTARTVEVIGDEATTDESSSQDSLSSEPDTTTDSTDAGGPSQNRPGITSGTGQKVSADEVNTDSSEDGDEHNVHDDAHDPNNDGEVETGLGWTVDADGHNT